MTMASRTVRMSQLNVGGSVRRSQSMETYMVRVYPGPISKNTEFLSVEALKNTQAEEIVRVAANKLGLGSSEQFELAETFSSSGQLCKERRLAASENPVRIQLMWPRSSQTQESHRTEYLFYLRRKEPSRQVGSWLDTGAASPVESFLSAFLQQPSHKEYPDLCNLPNLNETTLLQNLRSRFHAAHIYTYVGSILISVNPFKFYPIYNPKYVRMYQRRRLQDLPPHIFAIADAAFHTMLEQRRNQCIVISGESGSGKTESTNLLLHHLSALSQRDRQESGVERTILGAGPVLEAFGNAKTVHNNNSSRFGKFIQVNYRENGLVHGAVVEKYLLEKSRIVQQIENERNYHVFYYLLAGATEEERERLALLKPADYAYLNKTNCYTFEGAEGEGNDEAHEFTRLRQSMETVGFSIETQRRIFCVLSAVLHLGNIEYRKKADHQHHEAVTIKNKNPVKIISSLLRVTEETLVEALTKKKTTAGGETVVFSYNMPHALATRDAMAKCLYGGLFDWIVLQVNHALLAKKDYREHHGNSIGVLDIFGFEDFGNNSFEQFCINYANERLHYYFNQHIFKFEQEEYIHEGISWKNIEFIDNTGCLDLFARRLTGLLALIDEECNFPGATDDTLLSKLHAQHKDNRYYEVPQMKESAFTIVHYAGNVKYQIQGYREKNVDLMRHDIVLVLKNSGLAFVRELVGYDPVAVLRWAIVRAFFRAYFAFLDAGKRHRKNSSSENKSNNILSETPKKSPVTSGEQRPVQRRVIIVEKYANRHASYHGDMSADLLGPSDYAPESGLLNHREDNRVVLYASEAWNTPPAEQAFRKANRVLQKSKSFRPRSKSVKTFRDLTTMKALTCHSFHPRSSKGKNKPPSVSQQFNHSLSKLMETLNQANPFFIRCIKSNAEKAPIKFDEDIVLRQLRYTGMLATVRIRQSGYNYRLPFDEFIQQFKILLPHGLHSSRGDILDFLDTLELPRDSYQLGKTKIFLREAQKLLLDDSLHRAIITRIVNIQRWVKTKLERKHFLRLRSAVIVIQSSWRGFLARRRVEQLQLRLLAAIMIQRIFRGFQQRRAMRVQQAAVICIQSHVRGYLARRRVKRLREEHEDMGRQHQAATCIQKYIRRMCAMHKVDTLRHQRMIDRDVRDAQDHLGRPAVPSSPILSRDTLPAPAGRAASYYVGDDVPSPGSEKDFLISPPPLSPKHRDVVAPTSEGMTPADLPVKSQDRLSYQVETFVPSATIYTLPLHTDTRTITTASVVTSPERIMAEDVMKTSHASRTPNRLRTPISPKRSRPVPNSRSHLYEVKSSDKSDSPIVPDPKIPVISTMDIPNTVLTAERKKMYQASEIDLPYDPLKSVPSAPEFTDLRQIPQSGPDEFDAKSDSGRRWSGSSGEERVKGWEKKYMMKENQRKNSAASVKSQEGPQELEITIHPAVQKSPLQHATLDTDPARAPWSKKIVTAPLAQLESLTDSVEQDRSYGRVIRIERQDMPEEPTFVSERRDTLTSTEDTAELEVPNSAESPPALSPFHRAKKHLRNIMGGGRKHHKKENGEDSEGSEAEEPTSPGSSKGGAPHWPAKPGGSTRKLTKESIHLDQDLPAGKRKRRKNSRKQNREHFKCEMVHNTWTVSKTSKWNYPIDILVHGREEMRQLEQYMEHKIRELAKSENKHRETMFDQVFNLSVSNFREDLRMVMVPIELRYKDLMMTFEETLKAKARQDKVDVESDVDFPFTLAINAFRGYLDEFNKKKKPMKDAAVRETKKEKKTRKEKEREQITERLGHRFQWAQFNIPTYCELCSSVIWNADKGLVCQVCKYTIHKKCLPKIMTKCRTGTHKKPQGTGKLIGRALDEKSGEGQTVSFVIERMILAIELNGLYTVGLYRKAGAAGLTRKLINTLDHDSWTDIDFNDYPIHVLTSAIKTIFRELPEPLLTYELYDDFLRAAEIGDDKACIQLLYSAIDRLPLSNHNTLERLVFHLAKVAQHEYSNRMTSSSLAIVFAPSLLRCNRDMTAQESLQQVGKQTRCLDCIIKEQLRKIEVTLKDINSLETAAATATDRLSQVRASIRANEQQEPDTSVPNSPVVMETDPLQGEEKILAHQISTLRKEKEKLTITMPALECRHSSSEEDILSMDDIESTTDTTDGQDPFYEEFAVTFDDLPVSPSKSLRHLNKHRAPTPIRRQPTKRHSAVLPADKPASPNAGHLQAKPGLTSSELTQVGEEILV